ncbi:MAG TPA: ATP-binding protein [Pyrinomonadaceae bacterium]|jgi:signal transduction histidine kinase
MADGKSTKEKNRKEDGRIVYARPHAAEASKDEDDGLGSAINLSKRFSIAPTLTPLLIGFALLIGLVIGLGYSSDKQLKGVSSRALQLESQRTSQFKFLLRLQDALRQLNNEARARARVEGESGLMLPFKFRMRNAREELDKALDDFERLSLAQNEQGRNFRDNVVAYLEVVDDLERYSLEGFTRFQAVERGLENIIASVEREKDKIPQEIEQSKRAASESIFFLTVLSVLTGSLVAGGVVWEVQRRFRQLRRNIDDLRRERRFSRQMLKGMVSAIAAIDHQNHIRSANDAFFRVFPDARIGASIYDKFTTPEGLKMLASATATRVERPTYHGRWNLHHGGADGDGRTFDVYSSPLEIDNERGQLLMLVDATEAAQAENDLRRQEALAAVGRAAAQVAHEIKNPLGSIRLGVAMLRDMTGSPEAINTIDLVERGIDHLNKLTLDVTQFSRRKQLTLSDVDINELLDGSLELVADKIQEKQTPIERRFSAEPLRVECDADQLRQVFVNLFANAIDASPARSALTVSTARVSVERRVGRDGGSSNGGGASGRLVSLARIDITDAGTGMDEATRARIFEPFFTTKKRGTGLGLAIAKQIVEQHGGSLTVASTPGEGTTFTIDLPLKQSDK